MSEDKADVLKNQIVIYHKHRHDTTMFSNIQETSINTKRIVAQNNEMLRLLKELIDIKKSER